MVYSTKHNLWYCLLVIYILWFAVTSNYLMCRGQCISLVGTDHQTLLLSNIIAFNVTSVSGIHKWRQWRHSCLEPMVLGLVVWCLHSWMMTSSGSPPHGCFGRFSGQGFFKAIIYNFANTVRQKKHRIKFCKNTFQCCHEFFAQFAWNERI